MKKSGKSDFDKSNISEGMIEFLKTDMSSEHSHSIEEIPMPKNLEGFEAGLEKLREISAGKEIEKNTDR